MFCTVLYSMLWARPALHPALHFYTEFIVYSTVH